MKSTIFGIPLPVCSCGVLPLATSIKKSGASKGATLSFLISTPITGVDSIMATYGIFGWIFTLYRAITSMIIAMVAGILTNIFDKQEETGKTESLKPVGRGALTPTGNNITANTFSVNVTKKEEESCGTGTGSCCSSTNTEKNTFSLLTAMNYAFVTLLGDIAKPLFWGSAFRCTHYSSHTG